MIIRLISTVVLLPPALAAIWFGTPYFEIMVIVSGLVAIYEWCRVSLVKGDGTRMGWLALGVVYISLACVSLIALRADPRSGRAIVIVFFSIIWATDIGAYVVGRAIGGPKLAPAISPNKTWAGAIGGLVCATVAAFAAAYLLEFKLTALAMLIAAAVLSAVSQLGDLLESWWKRRFQVKDSGNLIPGHGGILDRIDGVLLASPVAAASQWVLQGGGALWK
jgi:phosphatidate cytidylyltransferase